MAFRSLYKWDLRGCFGSQAHLVTETRVKILVILISGPKLSLYTGLTKLIFYSMGKYLYHVEEQKSKFSVQTNCIELIINKSILRFLAPLSITLLQIKNFLTRGSDCWLYNFFFFFFSRACQIMLTGIKTA